MADEPPVATLPPGLFELLVDTLPPETAELLVAELDPPLELLVATEPPEAAELLAPELVAPPVSLSDVEEPQAAPVRRSNAPEMQSSNRGAIFIIVPMGILVFGDLPAAGSTLNPALPACD